MKRWFGLLMFILLPFTAQAADAPLVERLYAASGMQQQNADIDESLVAAFAEQRGGMSPKQFDLLQSSVRQAFNAKVFSAVVQQRMGATLSNEQVGDVLGWFDSELGQRFTAAEGAVGTAEGQQRMMREMQRMPQPDEKRLALMRQLDSAAKVSKTMGEAAFEIQLAEISGLMAVAADARRKSQLALARDNLYANKPQIMAAVGQTALMTMLYTYRDFSNEDIEGYIAFAESPSGRAYHSEASRGLINAYKVCSHKLGVLLGLAQRGGSMDI